MSDTWYSQIVHIPTGPHAQSRAEQTARELYGPHVVVDQVGWDPRADELLFGVTEEES